MSRPTDAAHTLGPNDVHVWLVDPDAIAEPDVLAEYAALLNADEHARRERFRFEKLRHDFLVARALVRTTLSRYVPLAPAEWQFTANEYGRPEICPTQLGQLPPLAGRLRFNLSHTRGLAALAVAWDCDLGVDVEAIDRRNATRQIAERFFAPAEVAELMSFPAAEQGRRFFDYWTLKESYIKARGMGLAIPLDQFAFCTRHAPQISIAFTPPLNDDPSAWQFFQESPTARHRLSLGVRQPQGEPLLVQTRWVRPLR